MVKRKAKYMEGGLAVEGPRRSSRRVSTLNKEEAPERTNLVGKNKKAQKARKGGQNENSSGQNEHTDIVSQSL